MAVEIANTEITQTFDYWRNRTNELAWTMSKVVLTTDGSLAPSSLIGNSVATGNTTITGTFFANQFTSNSRVTVKDSIFVNTASEVNGAITSSFAIINTTTISIGNVTSNSVLTNTSLTTRNIFLGSNVVVNTSVILVGDSSANNRISQNNVILQSNDIVNSVSNAALLRISNNSINSTLTYNSLVLGNTTVNSNIISVGSGVFTANDTSLNANGLVVNSSGAFVTNSTGVVNAAVHQVGTSFTANSTLVNTAAINVVGQTNTATLFVTTSANIASSNVIANTSGLFVANSTGVVNASVHSVGTAFTANSTLVNAAAVNIVGQTNTSTLFVSTSANIASSNVIANTSGLFVANSTGVVNAATMQVGTAFTANSILVNAAAINIVGQTNTATLFTTTSANLASSNVFVNTSGVFVTNSTGVVNAAVHQVGTSFTANSTLVNAAAVNIIGQTNTATLFTTTSANLASSNVFVNSAGIFVTNSTGVVNAAVHQVGTDFIVNSTGAYHTGIVNAANFTTTGTVNTATVFATGLVNAANFTTTGTVNTSTVYATGLINATSYNSGNVTTGTGGSVQNTTALFIGNNTINTVISSAGFNINAVTIANSSGVYTGVVNATTHSSGAGFTANSTVVNAVSYYSGTTLIGNTTGPYGKAESGLNVNSALTSNNSTYLNGQLASYYLNATNITSGTLPWAQAPTGTVNTSGSFTLSGNNTLAGTNTVISSNVNITGAFVNVGTLVNTAAINVRGQTNTNTLFVNSVANLTGNSTISGNWANVTGDLFVRGNLTVNGSLTYTANSSGDIIPVSNSFSLGNTLNRWGIYSVGIDNVGNTTSNNVNVTLTVNAANHTVGSDFIANSTGIYHTGLVNAASYRAGNVTTGTGGSVQNVTTMFIGNATINTVITSAGLNINAVTIANASGLYTDTVNAAIVKTGGGFNAVANGVYIDSDDMWLGNSSVSATVNSTFYSKTANNTSFVGSVSAVNVVSNAQLSANLSNYAALAGATFTGAVQVSNNVTITGNLIVSGTTVTVNTQTLDVKDLNITVAKGVGTAALADGAGLTVDTAGIGWYYHNSSNTWQSNVGITPSSNNSYALGTTGLRWSALFTNNITATTITATNVSSTDVYGTIKTATQGTIDHNSLANYDANKHIDHTTVSISPGNGLTGGGTIAATRTLSAVAANGISVTASGINVFVGNNQLVSNASGVWLDQTKVDHNSLSNYDANRHIDHTTVSVTAGNGLTGGGTIAATRTLTAVGANGISVTAAGINVLGNTGIVSNSSGIFANATYIQSLVNVSNGSVTTSGTAAQDIDNFAKASYFGAEYLISVSDNNANNKYITKTLVMHDGSTAQITEYGSITSNNSVGVFSATQNTTHIVLQFTPSLTATTVKYTKTVV